MTEIVNNVSTITHLEVDLQVALDEPDQDKPPSLESLSAWASSAYGEVAENDSEVTIRIVERCEIIELNAMYRNKDKATNVLSFPFESPPELEIPLLGDIVICHEVIAEEAAEQSKGVSEHYAHMVTHGVLHLCGYDHQDDDTAERMESLEIFILAQSGIANPYI